MLSSWKSGKVFVLSAVMFSAGVSAATIALSHLPIVTAAPKIVAGPGKQSKAERVIEEDGLKWDLQNCQRASQKVTCSFLVTNVGQKDRRFQFADTARTFDLSGNEYTANGSQMGNSDYTTLILGISTKASVNFMLPQEITKFAVLEVSFYRREPGTISKVQFRDVNVIGSQASNPMNSKNCTCPPQTNPKKIVTPSPR